MGNAAPDADEWLEPAQRGIVPRLRPWLAEAWPPSRVRAWSDGERTLADLVTAPEPAWFLPCADDRPMVESAVVAEEWGRSLAPGLLVDLNVVADSLRGAGAPPAEVDALRRGDRRISWAPDVPGRWARLPSGVSLRDTDSGVVADGDPGLVDGAMEADSILITARDGDQLSEVLVPTSAAGVTITPLDGLDMTRSLCRVQLAEVVLPPEAFVGGRGTASERGERQSDVALVLVMAASVGAIGAVYEQALADARVRIAFGRRIGSFQAVKHQLVDAAMALEIARAYVRRAALAVDEQSADRAEIVSMAKAYVGRAGIDIAHIAWQVLAGKAYMWDSDFHLYLRRITADASLYGDIDWHEQRVWALNQDLHEAGASS